MLPESPYGFFVPLLHCSGPQSRFLELRYYSTAVESAPFERIQIIL
jgi:hypothetical protein